MLLEAEFVDDPLLINLINSTEASGKTCEIWQKVRLLNDMATFCVLTRSSYGNNYA